MTPTGQLWQTKDCYVEIARVGKALVDYKMLRKPGQRRVHIQTGNSATVLSYLKANGAKLVPGAEASQSAA